MRTIDLYQEKKKILNFIASYFAKTGAETGIIGVSGGIDSAVIAALTIAALGRDRVLGVMLPYKRSNPSSLQDALTFVRHYDMKHRIIDITPIVDAWFDNNEPEVPLLRRGNYIARIRMTVLYDLSAKHKGLVVGTGNLSELMTGYTTQYGDNACAFEPIGHLYKTELRKLAQLLDLPQTIIDKKPSADLWKGQTDETEMGISYDLLDQLLYHLFEAKMSKEELVGKGYEKDDIERVLTLHRQSAFKRRLPPCITDWQNED